MPRPMSPNQLIAYAFSLGKIDAQARTDLDVCPTVFGQDGWADAIDEVLADLGGDETEGLATVDELIAAYERGWLAGKDHLRGQS